MIRKKAISVKVKAPSKGLVTRWPGETADRFELASADLGTVTAGMTLNRTCTVAQNMRFEDGAMRNAPGYKTCLLVTPLLANCVSHWRLDESLIAVGAQLADAFGSSPLSLFDDSAQFGSSPVAGQTDTGLFGGAVRFTFADGTSGTAYGPTSNTPFTFGDTDFTIAGWLQVLSGSVEQNGVIDKWESGTGNHEYKLWRNGQDLTFTVTGTDNTTQTVTASGVVVGSAWTFFCVRHDAANNFIRITANATTVSQAWTKGVYTGARQFKLGAQGGASTGSQMLLDSVTAWGRHLSNAEVTALYNTGSGLDFPFWSGSAVGNLIYEANLILTADNVSSNRPLLLGTQGDLYNVTPGLIGTQQSLTLAKLFTGTNGTAGYRWCATDFYDKVLFAQKDNVPQYSVGGNASTLAVPGLALNSTNLYSAVSDGYEKFEGVTTFFGHTVFWRQDLLLWSDVNDFSNYLPIGSTVISTVLTTSADFTQPAVGGPVDVVFNDTSPSTNPTLVPNMFVRMIYPSGGVNYYNYYIVDSGGTLNATHARLKLLGTTGRSAAGVVFAHPVTFTSVDANESGSARLVGAQVNGPIFQATQMGDYLYVFKEWSVQSLQYVGISSGTFYSRTEVVNEGLIGRNAMVNLGSGNIVFLGHRELYSYSGGSTPSAVCRQFTRQLLDELDRTRLAQIVMHHRQTRNEVWVIYPVLGGGQKVLIWNYVEDTASLDLYAPALGGLGAVSRSTWTTSLPWTSGSTSATWATGSDTESWADLPDSGTRDYTLAATGTGTVFVHGENYDRDGGGYLALAETMDFDFDDNTAFKYVDVVHIGLRLRVSDTTARTLYVQMGGRSTLDEDIVWGTAQALSVEGNANFTAKVNPGGAGRYLRLRFYSTDPGVRWEISSFEIFGRKGGTF